MEVIRRIGGPEEVGIPVELDHAVGIEDGQQVPLVEKLDAAPEVALRRNPVARRRRGPPAVQDMAVHVDQRRFRCVPGRHQVDAGGGAPRIVGGDPAADGRGLIPGPVPEHAQRFRLVPAGGRLRVALHFPPRTGQGGRRTGSSRPRSLRHRRRGAMRPQRRGVCEDEDRGDRRRRERRECREPAVSFSGGLQAARRLPVAPRSGAPPGAPTVTCRARCAGPASGSPPRRESGSLRRPAR